MALDAPRVPLVTAESLPVTSVGDSRGMGRRVGSGTCGRGRGGERDMDGAACVCVGGGATRLDRSLNNAYRAIIKFMPLVVPVDR